MLGVIPKYSFKQIKEHLQSLPAIRFSFRECEEKNPTDFIRMFFTYNREYNTIYNNNQIQTEAGKRRSIGDIYRIVYSYFPRVKMVTVYRTLLAMSGEGLLISSICQATGLRVYRKVKNGEEAYFNGAKTDEFGTDLHQFEELHRCEEAPEMWGYNYTQNQIQFIEI